LLSRGDEAGKVQALDLGATIIYQTVRNGELLARMRAALRHQLQVHGERRFFDQAISPSIWCAASSRSATWTSAVSQRIRFVADLSEHAGKVLTHKFLLGELWIS